MVVWEVAVEVGHLLRHRCRPREDHGHRLSRAVVPRSIPHQLNWGRSGQREEQDYGADREPPGAVQPLQAVPPLWVFGPPVGEERG